MGKHDELGRKVLDLIIRVEMIEGALENISKQLVAADKRTIAIIESATQTTRDQIAALKPPDNGAAICHIAENVNVRMAAISARINKLESRRPPKLAALEDRLAALEWLLPERAKP